MNNKIAIIVPYFGKFPVWMNLFEESCRYNNFVDFIFYTDCKYEFSSPNIKYYQISFKTFCSLVSESLDINFIPKNAYKLCGIRPFLGEIFKKELASYGFWGWCDIDLIFGDLKIYFNKNNLERFSVLSTLGDRISGPLCIFRNNEKNRKACFKIKNWKPMLMSEEMIPLDEKYFSDILIPEMKLIRGIYSRVFRKIMPLKLAKRLNDILSAPLQAYIKRYRKVLVKELNCTPEIGIHEMEYVYKERRIYSLSTNKEIIYLHFLFFKKNKYRTIYLWDDKSNLDTKSIDLNEPIYITSNGISN